MKWNTLHRLVYRLHSLSFIQNIAHVRSVFRSLQMQSIQQYDKTYNIQHTNTYPDIKANK